MNYPPTSSPLLAGCFIILIATIRYFLFAGIPYLIFYRARTKKWINHKIQQRFPAAKIIRTEIRYSLLTFAIFGVMGILTIMLQQAGLTRSYQSIDEYSRIWFPVSIVLMIIFHDAYFYWTHRLMHHTKLFPIFHKIHHLSHNPTPWASFSFHPLEAIVEAAVLPLMVVLFPIHPWALLIFVFFMAAFNVLGHLGFELFPTGFTKHPILGLINTSTHHNMHHKYFHANYGLYFNFWDRIMNTNHQAYHRKFETVCRERGHKPGNTPLQVPGENSPTQPMDL